MKPIYAVFLCTGLLLAACGTAAEQQLPTVVQIEATTAAATEVGIGTPEVNDGTPEADDGTPEADDGTPIIRSSGDVSIIIDEDLISEIPPNITEDDAYFITVTSFGQTFAEDDEPNRFILDASLANQSGASVTVNAADLVIVDASGERHEPVEMPENINPPLVGAELEEGDTLRGFAQYLVPTDVNLSHVEWCIGGDCEFVVGAALPLAVND
ncbi:DUF4352 domain-containing protein [bacterium]|nr:DUF4352 domain-containing protein [bacterium]